MRDDDPMIRDVLRLHLTSTVQIGVALTAVDAAVIALGSLVAEYGEPYVRQHAKAAKIRALLEELRCALI